MSDHGAGPTGETPVQSGSFRMDRAKALEKLQKYQLPQPWLFVRCWLRTAVLQGASRIEIGRSVFDASAITFDGQPFGESLLRDPPLHLLAAEENSSDAGRHLAIGLLGCLRLDYERVTLVSGHGTLRAMWSMNRGGPEEFAWSPGAEARTCLTVRWRDHADAVGFSDAVRASAALLVAELVIEDVHQLKPPASAVAGRRVAVSQRPGGGRLAVYRNGVLLAELPEFAREGADISVNDDELKLDLSASAAVRDERFNDTVSQAIREANARFPTER